MARWKIPPDIKIYEAFSVLADGRCEFLSGNNARIPSSNGAKSYEIEWQDGYPLFITANDNGTYYKGYAGYPIVSVLMLQGKIKCNPDIIALFAGIDWNALNKRLNNDYEAAIEFILEERKDKMDISLIRNAVESIRKQLADISTHKLNKCRKPPG